MKFSFNYYNEVSATFLARYIGKKLTYGHRLRSLLYPLRREFKQLAFRLSESFFSPSDEKRQRQRMKSISILNVFDIYYY